MAYRWKALSPDPELVGRLTGELGVSDFLASLMVNRGLADPDVAWKFLNPRLEDLHDPYQMLGMDVVVARLLRALDSDEPVLIYGDYDADGITATVLLKRALEMLGGRVDYYIPHRLEEGYGLKKEAIGEAAARKIPLVVSVDCGIRDFEACGYARELGIDLVVTDHHLPDRSLPPAYAILNPRQPGCDYPDKNLAAVGVALKLVQALFKEKGRESVVQHFLKVAAIGTVADMVPLVGENRTIVRLGLSGLAQPHNLGLQTLLAGAGVGSRVDHVDVGFKLAPRINAFTRMGGGREIVELFSVKKASEAERIVEEMNRKNHQRRAEENRILQEIDAQAAETPGIFEGNFIVVAGRDWHRGVIGNVASRLTHRFYRPTLAISLGDDGGQGSGRSISNFHLLDALEACPEFFERFGGHAQAVGCTLKNGFANEAGINELRTRLAGIAETRITEGMLAPELGIDTYLPIEAVSLDLHGELEKLAPFGIGNPVPVFASRDVLLEGAPRILKDQHLKLTVSAGGIPLSLIWWSRAEAGRSLQAGQKIDVAFTIDRDEFRGEPQILLTIKDLKSGL